MTKSHEHVAARHGAGGGRNLRPAGADPRNRLLPGRGPGKRRRPPIASSPAGPTSAWTCGRGRAWMWWARSRRCRGRRLRRHGPGPGHLRTRAAVSGKVSRKFAASSGPTAPCSSPSRSTSTSTRIPTITGASRPTLSSCCSQTTPARSSAGTAATRPANVWAWPSARSGRRSPPAQFAATRRCSAATPACRCPGRAGCATARPAVCGRGPFAPWLDREKWQSECLNAGGVVARPLLALPAGRGVPNAFAALRCIAARASPSDAGRSSRCASSTGTAASCCGPVCGRSTPKAGLRLEVIVVDNASTDGAAEMVRRELPATSC